MLPHVGCLLPTYNRFPKEGHLIEEAIECFLRQTYLGEKILVIGNDTPGQILKFVDKNDQVRVCNFRNRFSKLGNKIQAMIDLFPEVDVWCRWDDDDISLPHRLSMSVEKMGEHEEWHPLNYWWKNYKESLQEIKDPGNTHVMAIWNKNVINKFPLKKYPVTVNGEEDQTFNRRLRETKSDWKQEKLLLEDITYIYRWGVSKNHLSGIGPNGDVNWMKLGGAPIVRGVFQLNPHWKENYVETVQTSSRVVGEEMELGLHGVPSSESESVQGPLSDSESSTAPL